MSCNSSAETAPISTARKSSATLIWPVPRRRCSATRSSKPGSSGAADNDSITVFFSRDGVTFVQVDVINSTTDRRDPQHQPGLVRQRARSPRMPRSASSTSSLETRRQRQHRQSGDQRHGQPRRRYGERRRPAMTPSSGMPILPGATDGRDVVNGGTEGALGDTRQSMAMPTAETFNIYTRAAWIALGGGTGSSCR